jgi:POT family proton-dependent oligopeptide transporter
LLQLGLGFGAFWYGAHSADSRGMVAMSWLLIGYLLQTTGELCISPVGLSMVTMLSPKRIVSTVMGAWFLAMGIAGYLAGIIARSTSIDHEAGGSNGIPPPIETVGVYGEVFGNIAFAAIVSAVSLFALAPLLNRWTHSDIRKSTE